MNPPIPFMYRSEFMWTPSGPNLRGISPNITSRRASLRPFDLNRDLPQCARMQWLIVGLFLAGLVSAEPLEGLRSRRPSAHLCL